jgi:hypothetical protein
MNKIQVIDGYKYQTPERSQEIFNTIKWNSKIFDKIFILCENSEYFDHYSFLQDDTIRVINTRKNEFISMQDMFDFANANSLAEDIKFLSNLDSIFTKQFNSLDVEEHYVYSFTNRSMRNPYVNEGRDHHSYVRAENDGLILFNRDGNVDPNWFMRDEEISHRYWQNAVCGWAWKTVKPLNFEKSCFQCYPQAEQCMMHAFRVSGYNLKSAAIKFPTYHNHGSNEKTQNNLNGGMGFGGIINELL